VHRLLKRQLTRILGGDAERIEDLEDEAALRGLLDLVSETYRENDRDRALLERSLDLSSAELLERNRRLQQDILRREAVEAALRASEQRVKFHREHMRLGMVEWDTEWRVTEWNHAAERIFGYTREEMLGRVSADLIVPEVSRERVFNIKRDLAEGRSAQRHSSHRNRRKDDTIIYCEWSITHLLDAEGRPVGMAGLVQDVTNRVRYEEELLRLSRQDALTSLANRRHFIEALERAIARGARRSDYHYAVLFLDIDNFKVINDSLGHTAGDHFLVELARRLRSQVRGNDVVARLGGDEFAILLDDVETAEQGLQVANRIADAVRAPTDLSGRQVVGQVSVGIALSAQGHDSAEGVLRDADIALYRAKAQGVGGCAVFDREMHANAIQRLRLQSEITSAIERGELLLYFQPIVRLATGQPIACEALLRWDHPVRGLLEPGEFVPLAEEGGSISRIGRWVISEVCRELRARRDRLGDDFFVSINVTAGQLLEPDLVEFVLTALETHGLSSANLAVEITESVRLPSVERAAATLRQLRSAGIRVLLDDFGTRYSSLGSLHHLEVDAVKIDRTFVADLPRAPAIVDLILALTKRLDKLTVAEGVETADQADALLERGCELGQGRLFAPPGPAQQVFAMLENAG
jgi:diguanylate cyclase (GGDEF)-like protein/PAS domain S-box-containing protein